MERNDYQVEKAERGYPDSGQIELRRNINYDFIFSVAGLCAANPENPAQPRERQWYLDNVIAQMIERGEIGDGVKTRFDDRKLRYAGSTSYLETTLAHWDKLTVSFGVTHYKAFLADINRSDEDNLKLQER